MIPNQVSLNRFIIEVNELCSSHEMVQQSLFGDILRLYSQQQQKYYSIMWDFTTGSIDEKFVNLTAQFVVSGWVYSDYSNVENVKSDCQKIASDIFSGVQYSRRWQMIGKVNGSFNLEPFIERTGDKVAGWVVTMNFRLKRKHGICDVPFGDYDFDKDPTNGGNPVLIFENDILVATLYGGDTYYYTSGGTCDPVTSTFNGTELESTPSGENKDITVKYENDTLIGSIVTDTPNEVIIEVPNPIVCADGTILINGVVVGAVASGGMLNTAVENEDGTPLGSFIDGVWVVPNCPPPIVKSGVLFQSPVCLNPTQYGLYDEGWLFANGYFDDFIPNNPLYKPTLDTSITNYWYKLKENMPVNGNSNMMRFVDVDGGQTFSATGNKNLIMIDKFTGLGIYRQMIAPNTQQILMDNSQTFSITVDGIVYDDWHLITLDEVMQCLYGFLGQNITVTDPITGNVITSLVDLAARLLHTSSTYINSPTSDFQYQPINCQINHTFLKTATTRAGIYVTKQIRNLIGI